MPLHHIIGQYGYLALFVGVFFEGETILIAAAFAAHQGYMKLSWVIVTAFLGSLAGDQFYFFLGRAKGRAYLRNRPLWQIRVRKVQDLVERYHRLVIVGFRFLYGLRTVTPFALGMSDVKVRQFIFFNVLGALAWSTLVGFLGFLFGAALEALLKDVRRYERWIMLAILLMNILIWVGYLIRKRRLQRCALARLTGGKGTLTEAK
ncbi:MAG: DedA family protein [Syntrophorhabdales bacterium]|jgi:membrane protein DedA with SNARE-associated domain